MAVVSYWLSENKFRHSTYNVLGRNSGCCPRRAGRIAKRVLAISVTVTKRSSSLFRGKIATRKL